MDSALGLLRRVISPAARMRRCQRGRPALGAATHAGRRWGGGCQLSSSSPWPPAALAQPLLAGLKTPIAQLHSPFGVISDRISIMSQLPVSKILPRAGTAGVDWSPTLFAQSELNSRCVAVNVSVRALVPTLAVLISASSSSAFLFLLLFKNGLPLGSGSCPSYCELGTTRAREAWPRT